MHVWALEEETMKQQIFKDKIQDNISYIKIIHRNTHKIARIFWPGFFVCYMGVLKKKNVLNFVFCYGKAI